MLGLSFSGSLFGQTRNTPTLLEADVMEMNGLKDTCKVIGMGVAKWPIRDVFGRQADACVKCYVMKLDG